MTPCPTCVSDEGVREFLRPSWTTVPARRSCLNCSVDRPREARSRRRDAVRHDSTDYLDTKRNPSTSKCFDIATTTNVPISLQPNTEDFCITFFFQDYIQFTPTPVLQKSLDANLGTLCRRQRADSPLSTAVAAHAVEITSLALGQRTPSLYWKSKFNAVQALGAAIRRSESGLLEMLVIAALTLQKADLHRSLRSGTITPYRHELGAWALMQKRDNRDIPRYLIDAMRSSILTSAHYCQGYPDEQIQLLHDLDDGEVAMDSLAVVMDRFMGRAMLLLQQSELYLQHEDDRSLLGMLQTSTRDIDEDLEIWSRRTAGCHPIQGPRASLVDGESYVSFDAALLYQQFRYTKLIISVLRDVLKVDKTRSDRKENSRTVQECIGGVIKAIPYFTGSKKLINAKRNAGVATRGRLQLHLILQCFSVIFDRSPLVMRRCTASNTAAIAKATEIITRRRDELTQAVYDIGDFAPPPPD